MRTIVLVITIAVLLLATALVALQVDACGPACQCQTGACTCPESIGMQGCACAGCNCAQQVSGAATSYLGCPGCPGCPDNPNRVPGEPGCYGANYGCPGCPGCPGYNITPQNPGGPGCLITR